MKKRGHCCGVCGRNRANEKFSGKGRPMHICKDCEREFQANVRAGKMDFASRLVFVQVVPRPDRKLIVKRAARAEEYFAYCAEVGCQVWDDLKAIPAALGEPLGLWMPPPLRPAGTSLYVHGVEVATDFHGQVPDGFETLLLPHGWMMLFQGPPYEEARLGEAIDTVHIAMNRFDPLLYGYEWADDDAPRAQWQPIGTRGYVEARPVRPSGDPGIVVRV